jgi:hypothetical protein
MARCRRRRAGTWPGRTRCPRARGRCGRRSLSYPLGCGDQRRGGHHHRQAYRAVPHARTGPTSRHPRDLPRHPVDSPVQRAARLSTRMLHVDRPPTAGDAGPLLDTHIEERRACPCRSPGRRSALQVKGVWAAARPPSSCSRTTAASDHQRRPARRLRPHAQWADHPSRAGPQGEGVRGLESSECGFGRGERDSPFVTHVRPRPTLTLVNRTQRSRALAAEAACA